MNTSSKRFLYIGPKWQTAAGILFGGTVLYSAIPIVFPHWSRRFHQYYDTKGVATVVDESALSLLISLFDEMKMPSKKEAKLDVFISSSGEPEFYGSFSTRLQALIGVPANFNWKSKEDIQKSTFLKSDSTLDQQIDSTLCNSLMLSDDEKQFILARQIGYLDSFHFWVTLVLKLVAGATGYSLYHLGVVLSRLHIPHSRIRDPNFKVALIIVGSYVVTSFIYHLFQDTYVCSLDKYADKYAGTISPRIARAGVSYYHKQMDLYKILRELHPKLANQFSPSGNQIAGLIRLKTLPFATRKSLLEQLNP